MIAADAKEIDATDEWQVIGENDTIDAGMHIRIDMTTGEKWVKLPAADDEDDDTNNNKAESSSSASASSVLSVAVSANGEQQQQQADGEEGESAVAAESAEYDYDYEMMHRTLSQLPEEEKERIGLPGSVVPRVDGVSAGAYEQERAEFEARMKVIWEARQRQLMQMQEESVANLPQILKDRIASIRRYIQDPRRDLMLVTVEDYDRSASAVDGGVKTASNDNREDIVWVLSDLEYQLSDIDMARDFYTLGGWPLLVSLLSDDAHPATEAQIQSMLAMSEEARGNRTATFSSSEEADRSSNPIAEERKRHMMSRVRAIQAHAAWALGTAVKNASEFSPYAIETVVTSGRQSRKTTALDTLLDQLEASAEASSSAEDEQLQARLQKFVYALGAFLRGNYPAQRYFTTTISTKSARNGPEILGDVLSETVRALASASSSDADIDDPIPGLPLSTKKIMMRLVALADDIVTDVRLHAAANNEDPVEARAIVDAFSSRTWCDSILQLLQLSANGNSSDLFSLQETALKAVRALAPHCARWKRKKSAIWARSTELQDTLRQLRSSWEEDGDSTNPDIHRERMVLVEDILQLA